MNYQKLKRLSVEDWELMQSVLWDAENKAILKSPKLQRIVKILGEARK